MDDKTLDILKGIGGVAEGSYFADPKRMKPFEADGLVEGAPNVKNPANPKEHAYRLSGKGKAAVAEAAGGTDEEPEAFVIANVGIPNVSRLNAEPSKYPFDKLEASPEGQPEQGFFIPSDNKNASKSFGSMVAAQNKKYSKIGDYRRFTTRTMLGDAFGKKGVKGVAIFRLSAKDEAAEKATAFPTPAPTA